MFRLAFELWKKYHVEETDWKSAQEWRDGLARIAGATMDREYKDEQGSIVSEGNPDWRGKILIQTFDQTGKPTGWSVSSTRQTRDAAFHYLVEKSGAKLTPRSSSKTDGLVSGKS
jgi:hypothetical protein